MRRTRIRALALGEWAIYLTQAEHDDIGTIVFLATRVLIGPPVLDDLNAAPNGDRALLHLRQDRYWEAHLR